MSRTNKVTAALDGGERLDAGTDFGRVFNELCHLVALSRTSKGPQVVEGLVERALAYGSADSRRTANSVVSWISSQYGVSVPTRDVRSAIESLVQQGHASRPSGVYTLQESRKAAVLRAVEQADDLEARVRAEWLEEVDRQGLASSVTPEVMWACLRAYMLRVLRQHGALAAHVLNPAIPTDPQVLNTLNVFLDEAILEAGVPVEQAEQVTRAITGFYNESSADRVAYIAQHLDAAFTFFALSAPDSASSYLRGQMQDLDVFVDTNFIFDLLFDDSDEGVAGELIAFIREMNLPIRLLYHERTKKELETTLGAIGSRLRSRHWSQSVSSAAVRTRRCSGVEMKYHTVNAQTPMSADVFMRRYENHLPELLRDHGIEVYRSPKDVDPATEQERHLLVAEYQAFVDKNRPDKEKSYETADHDIAVWLAIRHVRRPAASSTLDSGALFLSNDRFFQFFEAKALRRHGPTAVVLPRTLLQVLRPFAMTGGDYDRRFVRAFAASQFRTAHTDYKETTSELMSHLGSYKDLPEETAVKVLGDELLLSRLQRADTAEEFHELVENKVVDLNSQLLREKESWEAELGRERDERSSLETRLTELESARDAQRVGRETAERRAADERRAREAAESAAAQLDQVITQQQERLTALDTAITRFRQMRDIVVRAAIGVGVAMALLTFALLASRVSGWPPPAHPHRVGIWWSAGAIAISAGWVSARGPHRGRLTWILPVMVGIAQIL